MSEYAEIAVSETLAAADPVDELADEIALDVARERTEAYWASPEGVARQLAEARAPRFAVGEQVQFAENEQHDRVLGVVSRAWPNGRYVTVISDGRTFVRDASRVTRCG